MHQRGPESFKPPGGAANPASPGRCDPMCMFTKHAKLTVPFVPKVLGAEIGVLISAAKNDA